jgi:hypothetical protein
MTTPGTFRLMDLPKDIRLCIYDVLPIKTRHVKISTRCGLADESGYVTLVVQSLPVEILRVNKEIKDEAQAILKKNLTVMASATSKVVLSWTPEGSLGGGLGVALEILQYVLKAAIASVGGHYTVEPMIEPDLRGFVRRYYYTEMVALDQKVIGQFIRHAAHHWQQYLAARSDSLSKLFLRIVLQAPDNSGLSRRIFGHQVASLAMDIASSVYSSELSFLIPIGPAENNAMVEGRSSEVEELVETLAGSVDWTHCRGVRAGSAVTRDTWASEWAEGERL